MLENAGLENTQKNVVFEHAGLEGAEGAENAENTQKHVFSRCGAFRRPRCDVEKARKNTCFRPQGSEKTRKNACFFEGPRRKHAKTCEIRHNQTHWPKTRKNTCFRLFGPPGGQSGPRPAPLDAPRMLGCENHAFLRVFATPMLEKHVFLRVFEGPKASQSQRKGPGPAPKARGRSPVSATWR